MAPKRKTILVIDDEASVRKVINKILVNRGYGVLETENYDFLLVEARRARAPVLMCTFYRSHLGQRSF